MPGFLAWEGFCAKKRQVGDLPYLCQNGRVGLTNQMPLE